MRTRISLFLLSAALLAPLSSANYVTCHSSDQHFIATPCDWRGFRTSIGYYTKQCDPSTSDELPAPRQFSCSATVCGDGMFYDLRTLDCTKCPKGTVSLATSTTIDLFTINSQSDFYHANENEMFDNVATYCTPQPCSPWKVDEFGKTIWSGNQSAFTHKNAWGYNDETVDASFSLITQITDLSGGSIRFEYRVESEKGFDGLVIYVNGTYQVNPDQDAVGRNPKFWGTGLLHKWRKGVIQLPFGRHDIRFSYQKDSNQFSSDGNDVGADGAYLQNVIIDGVKKYAEDCDACPAGTFSAQEGQRACISCGRNQYSTSGASACVDCTTDQWAPAGSPKCFDKLPCANTDYVAQYSQCTSGKRTQSWKLINANCKPGVDGAFPAESKQVGCDLCMAGTRTEVDTASGATKCVKCPEGQIYSKDKDTCTDCGPGTAAIPVLDYSSGFDVFGGTLPSTYITDCQGVCPSCTGGNGASDGSVSCDSRAFQLASYPFSDSDGTVVGIRQSNLLGSFYTATLQIPIELITDGSVEVLYAFYDPNLNKPDVKQATPPSAVITIDGFDHVLDSTKTTVSDINKVGRVKVDDVKTGKHSIVLSVIGSSESTTSDRVDVVILGIKVLGEVSGGAGQCIQCTAGHFCPGKTSRFVPCSPGTYASGTSFTQCKTCPQGYAVKEYGRTYCDYCYGGTFANADHTLCENTCNISFWGYYAYDLTPLKGTVFGPLTSENVGPSNTPEYLDAHGIHRFFVSPCTFVNADKSSDTCTHYYGSEVENAYACQRINANWSYSLGDDVRYTLVNGRLVMKLTGGDRCHHQTTAPRSSNITFVCDPSASPGTLTFVNEMPACQYNFVLTSKYSCQVCLNNSFARAESECDPITETKTIKYYKESWAAGCEGGVVPPPPFNVSCRKCHPNDYMEMWSDCEGGSQSLARMVKSDRKGCIEDKLVFNATSETRACHKIEATIGANTFTAGILSFALIVGGAIITIYVLHRRHSDLKHKYQRLAANASEAAEMGPTDAFESNDDEDDGIGFSVHNQPARSVSRARSSSQAREAVEALNLAIAAVPPPLENKPDPVPSVEPHAA